jgi:hypothetical protein
MTSNAWKTANIPGNTSVQILRRFDAMCTRTERTTTMGTLKLLTSTITETIYSDQLELKFIDFQTCLAIIDMLLKEKRALKVDYNDLKNFHKDLEDEMNKLNDWFSGGTF